MTGNAQAPKAAFFGWKVVAGAFVMAIFAWGLGFHGTAVYVHQVSLGRGWSVGLVSAAVTFHLLVGAAVVTQLPKLFRRFGLPNVTRAGSLALCLGLMGWALAAEPWQMFLAAVLTGGGWVALGAVTVNTVVAAWFVRQRPKALSMAYNGASLGGALIPPLLVALTAWAGFSSAVMIFGGATVIAVWFLASFVFPRTPASLGQHVDGTVADGALGKRPGDGKRIALPGRALWRDWRFRTLAAGMALALFAQIGLLAHLFSMVAPALGAQYASLVIGLGTAAAILGRTAFGWMMGPTSDRRRLAALSLGLQILGVGCLAASGSTSEPLVIAGALLFGLGIGNATTLPPLIAQVEFAEADAPRVVALVVAIAQATYAFAPLFFGLARELSIAPGDQLRTVCILVGAVQALAAAAYLSGGSRSARDHANLTGS